ncbi:MAG: Uma2 family endonuclease [Spirochaetota bacterium]
MAATPREKGEHFNYRDYLAWDDDRRFELIDGRIYDVSPAPNRAHQEILMEFAALLHEFYVGKPCRVYPAPFDVRLPRAGQDDMETDTVVQPDISVVCDQNKLDDSGCRGAPDIVVEIISPATASKDQVRKLQLYEQHGVREYYIVHPADRLVRVYRLAADGRFSRDEVYDQQGEIESGVAEGLRIKVAQLFKNLPPVDEAK